MEVPARSRCDGCPLQDRRICGRDRPPTTTCIAAFVGSSPASYEVKANRASTGDGPKVLRQSLSTLGFDLSACGFTHIPLCQTPKARKAKVDEVRACTPGLEAALAAWKPRVIVAMGDDAHKAFTHGARSATTQRGRITDWRGTPVMLTLDPHDVVKVHPRYAPADEVDDAAGTPDRFPDLFRDLERVAAYLQHGTPLVAEIPAAGYYLASDRRRIRRLIARLKQLPAGTPIALDVETDGLDWRSGRILTLGMSWKVGTAASLDWSMVDRGIARELAVALEPLRLIFHNGYYDVPWLRAAGVIEPWQWAGDTMLLHYLEDERPGTHGLERLGIDLYSWPAYETALKEAYRVGSAAHDDSEASYANVPTPALMAYNATDCDLTLRLWSDLPSNELHDRLLMPAARHFLRLEDDGMLVDRDYLEETGARWAAEMRQLESTLGESGVNLDSPKQVAAYLFDVLGLEQMPARGGEYVDPDLVLRLTDGVKDPGAQEYFRVASSVTFMKLKPRSTSTYMLWWLADQHPWPRALVRYRVIGTRYKSYYRGTLERLIEGRIRPRYRLHGTRTGRLSSTNPNIHGIARDLEIKNIFIADPGYTLIAADYSQAEVRMMAHYARDEVLMAALAEGDIHRAISRRLFRLTEEELSALPDERVKFFRRAAKTIIFGLIYGRSTRSLAPQLGLTLAETDDYIQKLFETMPAVPRFIERQQLRVIREQRAVSLYGRQRHFPLLLKANLAQVRRQGVNMPIQSSVSDMTLEANLRIIERLDALGVGPKVWPHIHDGFLFQVPTEHVAVGLQVAREELASPRFETDVNFAFDIETGQRWGGLVKAE